MKIFAYPNKDDSHGNFFYFIVRSHTKITTKIVTIFVCIIIKNVNMCENVSRNVFDFAVAKS